MASAVPVPSETGGVRHSRRSGHPGVAKNGRASADFRALLARSLQHHRGAAHGGSAGAIQPATATVALAQPTAPSRAQPVPSGSEAALDRAMALEKVPADWKSGLGFIMAQESGGRVNVQSPLHSARGLFQLTAANYGYNPHGAASFGNGVEEAQGGIRYIRQRYGTADRAVQFWQAHHWY